jgi:RNA polymerase sigma factor (sigma-70 family)
MGQLDNDASDTDLWSHVLNGDGEAFAQVFDRYRDRVFNYSRRLVRSSQEAEDVTAMVFLETWRCRKNVKVVNGALVGWLLVTTNNVARNHLRSTLRYRRLIAKLPPPTPTPDPGELAAENLDRESQCSEVQEAFQSLNHKDKEILALGILEELSMTEVAAILNVPRGTVKSRLSRAKNRLARLLENGTTEQLQERIADGRMP